MTEEQKEQKHMNQQLIEGKEPLIKPIEEWAEALANRKPRPQLIQDILANQRGEYMAIAGRTGIGKTNLALCLGFCLATGTPFFELKCRKVKVAFLAFEGDSFNLMERYNKLKGNFPPTERKLRFAMLPLSNPKHMFDEVFDKTDGCRVIILDPVKYIVLGEYLKPKDADTFLKRFKEYLPIHKMSAIITLPIRKPNEKSLIRPGDVYSMKGATEYSDAATSVLLLEKKAYDRSSDEVALHFAKQRIAPRELGSINLSFNRNSCLFEPQNGGKDSKPEEEGGKKVKYPIMAIKPKKTYK